MFHDIELQWIFWIHQWRSPLLDTFFKGLNFFDRLELFLLLIPLLWIFFSWKSALKVLSLALLSRVVNGTLKAVFLSPRPFHLDPSVGVLQVSGHGFPSGAAQTVILLSAFILTSWKTGWKWVVVVPYVILISFSRIYLGVHFPTDILAGWVVGILLWVVYKRVFFIIGKKGERGL